MTDQNDLIQRVQLLEEEKRKIEEEKRQIEQEKEHLEEEKKRLEQQLINNPTEVTSEVTSFKGRKIITFKGPFRPFSFGLRKASVIIQKIDDIKKFVEDHGQDQPELEIGK